MDWDKLIAKTSSKGDLATVLICGTVGFIGDAVSTFHGVISPGYFAGLAASGGLGAKNLIGAGIDRQRDKAAAKLRGPNALAKAKGLLPLMLNVSDLSAEANRLERSIALFENPPHILPVEEFEKIIDECAAAYLKP